MFNSNGTIACNVCRNLWTHMNDIAGGNDIATTNEITARSQVNAINIKARTCLDIALTSTFIGDIPAQQTLYTKKH